MTDQLAPSCDERRLMYSNMTATTLARHIQARCERLLRVTVAGQAASHEREMLQLAVDEMLDRSRIAERNMALAREAIASVNGNVLP